MIENPFDKLIARPAFCTQAAISVRTAELWAHRRKGPKVTHIGGRAYYHVDDVTAWIEASRNKSPSPQAQPRKRRAA